MSYGLIYTLPFMSIKDELYRVDIEKKGYEGECYELKGTESPFTLDIDDNDFMYQPLRLSQGTLKIFGGDYLQVLFSGNQDCRVSLIKDNIIIWCGYVKPETYTQDFTNMKFIYELKCISCIESLKYINYKQQGENRDYISFKELLKYIISESGMLYDKVVLPNTYRGESGDILTLLSEMMINEQDFFDEEDVPMKLDEVLEEVCKYLQWTCTDWCGALWFVDTDYLDDYCECNNQIIKIENKPCNQLSVQDLGRSGASHALGIIAGFNKVTVKCDNYGIEPIQWKFDIGDLRMLVAQDTVKNQYDPDNEKIKEKASRRLYYFPSNELKAYSHRWENDSVIIEEIEDMSLYKDNTNEILGALPAKICNYEYEDDEASIHQYKYDTVIQLRALSTIDGSSAGMAKALQLITAIEQKPVITFKRNPMLYESGAFSFSGYAQASMREDMQAVESHYIAVSSLRCVFRIGNKWYDGNKWVDTRKEFGIFLKRESSNDWSEIENTKLLEQQYDDIEGQMIFIDEPLRGDMEVTVYMNHQFQGTDDLNARVAGIRLKDFALNFAPYNESYSFDNNDSDRLYENEVNEGYINELDEITLKISTNNDDGACYGKVIIGNNYVTTNIFSNIENQFVRMEEHLIRRIVNRYQTSKFKLSQELKYSADIQPFSIFNDRNAYGKKFQMLGGKIDYKMRAFEVIMIERGIN